MADNHFDLVMVYDQLGGNVRVRRGGSVTVVDPATDAPLTVLDELTGISSSTILSDASGRVQFIAQQGSVKLLAGGLSTLAISAESATSGAANAAAAQAAQAAAETAATDAAASAASASGKVPKNTVFVDAADQGVVANGTTNDSAALLTAANAAVTAGATLRFKAGTTVALSSKVSLPSNLSIQADNVTFKGLTANSDYLLAIGANTRIVGSLTVLTASSTSVRGVSIFGANIDIDSLTITCPVAGAGAGNNLAVGLNVTSTNIRIGQVKVSNFDYPVRVFNSTNVTFGLDLDTYLRGVYLLDCKQVNLTGTIKTASPNAALSPGHNGVLIEANTHDATTDIRLNLTVSDAGEHGFRIGGSKRVKRVWFTDCTAVNVGGSGLKVLGGTTADNNYHEDIFITNFVGEDCGQTVTNTNGIQLEFTRRAMVSQPIIRKNLKTYSAGLGIQMQACEYVTVIQPTILDTMVAAYRVDQILGNSTQVQLIGGVMTSVTGNGVEIDYSGRTYRRVSVEGMPQLDFSGGYSVKVTNTSGGAITGGAWLTWRSVSSAATQLDPASLVAGYYCDVRAAFVTNAFKNGSTWFDSSGASSYRRLNGTWYTQGNVAIGAGSPEAVLAANVGTLYTRTDGGAGTTLYVKETGSGNTGWVAK